MSAPTLAGRPWMRGFGADGPQVSAICMGGAQLGSMPDFFGQEVTEADAIDIVHRVFQSPIRFLDTSNGYGHGRSEVRIGKAIEQAGGLPPDFVISTKVDAKDGDYSGRRVRTSVAESMERLRIGRLPVVFLHDPEYFDYEEIMGGGAIDTLAAMKAGGEIGLLGLAGGDTRELRRYFDLGVFDALLVHNRWTLVDRSADQLINDAARQGLAVMNAAALGGGLLTGDGRSRTTYAYRPAAAAVLQSAPRMAALCADYGTDLQTAALQFSLRDPRISSTVVGFTHAATLARTLASAQADLPDAFWNELEDLVPDPKYWLDAEPASQ
ncbi:MAG: aldo/keto reductase [Beutenbergiaceae bacterium]